MAAEMVGSAVAQEAVTQVLSRFKERYQEKSDAKERMERLEMAHIKLEAALEASQRWSVTSAPLLRWRSKLKRAAQECDHTLRRCKQRLQEEEEAQHQREVRSCSLPKRIAHAARSLVSSIFEYRGSDEDDELRGPAAIRRFERFAEGAGEFLRYVELGGTPHRRYTFFDALVQHLLAGKGTKRCFVDHGDGGQGQQHLSFLLHPLSPPDRQRGMEGALVVLLDDGAVPENSFMLSLTLRLSESTDVVGVVVRCLQLFTAPLLLRSSAAETVKAKLAELPTQDLCWVPDAYSVSFDRIKHQHNLYTASSKWFRPNPLCCQRQDHHNYAQSFAAGGSSSSPSSEPSSPYDDDAYLEAVGQVNLLGHVALSGWSNRQRSAGFQPYLKLGVQFWPHASCEDLSPAVGGSATEMINGVGEATATTQLQHGLYSNICFQELLGEILLQKAAHYIRSRSGSSAAAADTSYQMLWRSRHGRAYLKVQRASWPWRATTREGAGDMRQKRRRPGNKKQVQAWTSGIVEFMSSWIAHAPAQLQAMAVDWIQKQERSQLPLLLKTNPCIHDCPIMLLSLQDLRSLARKIKSLRTLVT
ncbi:hypothetical protein U9M48_001972 [Paspalum notatum var. saurae]|uniref:Uncharacterized protein n=1 Tax=Paspalum notatum var. saurae TaxID=547442 RepID=A0AAQ3SH39_PASNO